MLPRIRFLYRMNQKSFCPASYVDCYQIKKKYITCQKRISCIVAVVGIPSGHIGMTTYTANLSLALILLAIFSANSMGIRFSAPGRAKAKQK